ncbi:MAG: hypothetical protein AABY18_08160 [Candidatus Thermoplasmatota archaeon]
MRLNGWAWFYVGVFVLDLVAMALVSAGKMTAIDLGYLIACGISAAVMIGFEVNRTARRDAKRLVEQR